MKAPGNNNDIIRSFEVRLFHYGLIVAFIFRLIRTVHEYMIGSPLTIMLIGVLNMSLIIFLFWLYRRHYTIAFIIFYFQILLTSVITWNNSGGWNGTVPYLLMVVTIAILITSYGLLQVISLLAYSLIILLFGYSHFLESFSTPNTNYSLLSRELDFMTNTLILILITFYLKENFLSFRESVELNNARLKKSTETLIEQTRQLYKQQEELSAIRNKLEATIPVKISEAQNKAEALREYAFINAHHVRGPLARVLGLISLIELDGQSNSSSDALHKIKRDAQEMDTIIMKINKVIS